jgi:hypothetical protein
MHIEAKEKNPFDKYEQQRHTSPVPILCNILCKGMK